MDEGLRPTIELLMQKVDAKAKELAELKRTINVLAREAGGEPIYPDVPFVGEMVASASIRPDQFYGKSPTTAAREFLESRGRAVAPEEILDALERGGFDFEEQGWKKPDRLRSLAISLSKNSLIFHRLPNGTYGLLKFYPDITDKKKKNTTESAAENNKKSAGEKANSEVAEP